MKKNIKKVKKYQKLLICLVVMLLMVLSFIVGKITNANANEINYEYQSSNIEYDSTNNNLTATNVKDAIDELYEKVGKCPTGQFCYSSEEIRGISRGNILRAYVYDETENSSTFCTTGEEESCIKSTCYDNLPSGSCASGTIIDYFVNNATVVRFHVLHDDGETMTMQAQQSQVKGIQWDAREDDTSYGPETILPQLEIKTSDWINVNDIEYNGDNTKFVGIEELSNIPSAMKNNNNYCTSYNSCGKSTYTYPTRIVKARMIMLQEAVDVGCTTNDSSCPKFMYNYLYYAMNYGAIKNDNTVGNWGYWTMSAKEFSKAWFVDRGNMSYVPTSNNNCGARAVVVVNK